jgi:O-antigen/teichoic acid export membrane protein
MAIIACPDCGKKISSHAVICSFCGFQLGEATQQDLEVFRARKLRDQRYRLNMMSYLVITIFVAGFAWYWWDSKGFLQPPSIGPMALMGIAAIAYIIVRAFLFQNRRVQRALQREQTLKSGLGRKL